MPGPRIRASLPYPRRTADGILGTDRLGIVSASALCAYCRWRHYGHAWQHEHGTPSKPPHHNKEFRTWCEAFGIQTDEGGHDLGVRHGSPFEAYCRSHGIGFPAPPGAADPTAGRPRGLGPSALLPVPPAKPKGSRMKKWTCQCGVNVRVAIAAFDATCNVTVQGWH